MSRKIAGKEVLIHNISHADLILGIKIPGIEEIINARPKFSHFHEVSREIYNRIIGACTCKLYFLPYYEKRGMRECGNIPIGFELGNSSLEWKLGSLRLRDDDKVKYPDLANDSILCRIEFVYFPLISVLYRKWLDIAKNRSPGFHQVLVLVSGRGKPIDTKAEELDNSTEFTGKMIEAFLNFGSNSLEIHLLHSNTNLFRYDANIIFVKKELLPKIAEIREELLNTDGEPDLKRRLKLTLSFADGSTARISAINASLKHYCPNYMHFWVLKTFWREKKIYLDDVEFHYYEEVSTDIAVKMDSILDPYINMAIEEMLKYREYIFDALQGKNDLASFWLRKTKKLVLAVLVVEKPNEKMKVYRGTNMEVSMPTGSLCAERNVIGSALAADITLSRKDIKVVAVYSVPSIEKDALLESQVATPSMRSQQSPGVFGSTGEPANKNLMVDVSHERRHSDPETTGLLPKSPSSDGRKVLGIAEQNNSFNSLSSPDNRSKKRKRFEEVKLSEEKIQKQVVVERKSHSDLQALDVQNELNLCDDNLYCSSSLPYVASAETIFVKEGDLNPIKPCGACNEWLKKIAEVNPKLKVVTFTDSQCFGVYVNNISE